MSSQQTVRGGLDRGRGWRGTARSRGGVGSWRGSRSSNPIRTSLQQPPPPQALGPTVDAINTNNLLVELDAPTIEDVSYVASYNWVNGKSPVILVPGQLFQPSTALFSIYILPMRFAEVATPAIDISLIFIYFRLTSCLVTSSTRPQVEA